MSTITYSRGHVADVPAKGTDKAARRGFWRRVFDAIVASQQRRADREIAAFLQSRGGVFTDDTERELTRRLLGRRSSLTY